MIKRLAEDRPRFIARSAGIFYMVIIVAAAFAEAFVRGSIIIDSSPSETAANILAQEPLFRLGGAADLIAFACDAAVALIFYELFTPVSAPLSLLAAFFRLMHVAIVGINTVNHFAPLALLKVVHFSTAFKTDQLQALALVFLKLHGLGYNIGLVFFGFHCVVIGYLIYRSYFLPRIFGALMAIAGLCYLTNSFANLLSPTLAVHLFPWILLPGIPAEWGLALWLLTSGVNSQRWKEQAGVATA